MNRCLLIQANGNNVRLGKYFKQPKYELYYKNNRIINTIIDNGLKITSDVYVAIRKNISLNFDTSKANLIPCDQTTSRLDTLKQCFPYLNEYLHLVVTICFL